MVTVRAGAACVCGLAATGVVRPPPFPPPLPPPLPLPLPPALGRVFPPPFLVEISVRPRCPLAGVLRHGKSCEGREEVNRRAQIDEVGPNQEQPA